MSVQNMREQVLPQIFIQYVLDGRVQHEEMSYWVPVKDDLIGFEGFIEKFRVKGREWVKGYQHNLCWVRVQLITEVVSAEHAVAVGVHDSS